ncbi:MAG: class I SAM-dependent methyltransferase [Saprospiraceae bacterium]
MKTQFGNIDIYLFDQLLKERFETGQRILDAGCGEGRNLYYFLKQGYDTYGIDQNSEAIEGVKAMARDLAPACPSKNFVAGSIEKMPFAAESFDWVICNAVLHFAQDQAHFEKMLDGLWKVVKPGGYLWIRLASSIGLEADLIPVGQGRFLLPDASERFLVSMEDLIGYTKSLDAELFEFIKTTNVQNLRCMTTWCLQKKGLF